MPLAIKQINFTRTNLIYQLYDFPIKYKRLADKSTGTVSNHEKNERTRG